MKTVWIKIFAAGSPKSDRVDSRSSLAKPASEDPRPDELEPMEELARQREADAREVLLEGVFYKVLDGPEADFDPDGAKPSVKRTLTALADVLRAEITRRGLTPADLDLHLRWPEGRTERRLNDPSELDQQELDLLCQSLGTTMDKLL